MVGVPSFSTPATESLCAEIAKKSKGICFFGFSGGKDSLCALLYVRKFFDKVYAFHCASVPGMRFREEYLRYVEDELDIHFLRMMDASLANDLAQGIYQLPCDAEYIASLGLRQFDKLELTEFLRNKFNLPRAWCAFGINACDSQDRRIQCVQYKGRHDTNKTFYPTWDWPHGEIVRAVAESGVQLSSEYRYTSRTIEGTPSATHTRILRQHYPDDFRRLKAFYPLCEAKDYRERLNARVLDELKAERIRKGGGGDGAAGGKGSFADVIAAVEGGEKAARRTEGAGKKAVGKAGATGGIKPSSSNGKGRKAPRKGSAKRGDGWEPSRRDIERRADERIANGPFRAWEEAAKSDPEFYTKLWAEMKDRPPKACKSEDGFDFFEGEEMDRLLEYRYVKEMAELEARRNGLQMREADAGEEGIGDGQPSLFGDDGEREGL